MFAFFFVVFIANDGIDIVLLRVKERVSEHQDGDFRGRLLGMPLEHTDTVLLEHHFNYQV
jgi:hypothetical protein